MSAAVAERVLTALGAALDVVDQRAAGAFAELLVSSSDPPEDEQARKAEIEVAFEAGRAFERMGERAA